MRRFTVTWRNESGIITEEMDEDDFVEKVLADFSDLTIADLISKKLGTPHGAYAFGDQMVTFRVIE
jgi:fructose/tagatose bisphosphate aldolase